MSLTPLLVEPIARAALLEDLGRGGDLTSEATIPPDRQATAALIARDEGVVAGIEVARMVFELVSPEIEMQEILLDGARVHAGGHIASIRGPAAALLTAERTALNFLSHLSGIATATAQLVAAIADTKAQVCCTRKTTPGLRGLEKYAVRAGGGTNHRFGLDDAVLIKDNHIAIAGGISPALQAAKARVGHMVKIQIEVGTIAQLTEALEIGVDAVLLDNMEPPTLATAVSLIRGQAVTEASGRISPAQIRAVADAGVDLISCGWLTHSAPILDIGLDIEDAGKQPI
ncbi:MAG TPA: carboxylating nicotinate-nucleotide diphosphorylase [Actinomycetales bacterium]|nr:carboxylating nicotinate-nucleotide diphosphorylase [Actinomycetales bacterium]